METIDELRATYEREMAAMRAAFAAHGDGDAACATRAAALDALVTALWTRSTADHTGSADVAIVAIGGYGRGELFPFSDIDLLFVTAKPPSSFQKDGIRQISQGLWDLGLKAATATRALADCEPFPAGDPESGLALLDLRPVAGSETVFAALRERVLGRRSDRQARALAAAAAGLTRERHTRFGRTLFHLEPNVKDAPGGLRDLHVCRWLRCLRGDPAQESASPFAEAARFLTAVRVFLHLRHGREDNTLDWHAQDAAAREGIGLDLPRPEPSGLGFAGLGLSGLGFASPGLPGLGLPSLESPGRDTRPSAVPALWMRSYFRHARAVERQLLRELEHSGQQTAPTPAALRAKVPIRSPFLLKDGVLDFRPVQDGNDPSATPEAVFAAFGWMASAGVLLGPRSEQRLAAAIPQLSATIEDGPRLWVWLRPLLTGRYAASALRELHALGLLELIVPEFHGIDALVIRDAYHRYTVDEHTFVLIEALHELGAELAPGAPEWRHRFRHTFTELPHPELLVLAALLHDTGKGRAGEEHAAASAKLAATVCARLELGNYETQVVLRLIELHLEMSTALRRDIFDTETVRVFAEQVGTHDLLRMLTLLTYADISAVHPDALTPWKAENLWRLSMAAANQLDRSVDQERLDTYSATGPGEVESLLRALGRDAPARADLEAFLNGFPERYLRTRSAQSICEHLRMASSADGMAVQLTQGTETEELTVVSRDRPHLFVDLTAVLAGWGMEVVTANAFSNAAGLVVDTFSFQDTYGTLRLNPEERPRLRDEMLAVLTGKQDAKTPTRRRRPGGPVRPGLATTIVFDQTASARSTLLEVVTRNIPGLLHAAARVFSEAACSVEVALVDTEGDLAIDVFYLTCGGHKLDDAATAALQAALLAAIQQNTPQ